MSLEGPGPFLKPISVSLGTSKSLRKVEKEILPEKKKIEKKIWL